MVSQTQRLQQPMTSNDQNHPKWSAQDVWLRPSSQRSTSKVRQFSVKDGELKAELALESDKREKLGIKGITVFLCSHILLNNQDWSSREPTPTCDLQGIYITTHGGFSFQPSKSDARMRIKLQCREVEQPRHTQWFKVCSGQLSFQKPQEQKRALEQWELVRWSLARFRCLLSQGRLQGPLTLGQPQMQIYVNLPWPSTTPWNLIKRSPATCRHPFWKTTRCHGIFRSWPGSHHNCWDLLDDGHTATQELSLYLPRTLRCIHAGQWFDVTTYRSI